MPDRRRQLQMRQLHGPYSRYGQPAPASYVYVLVPRATDWAPADGRAREFTPYDKTMIPLKVLRDGPVGDVVKRDAATHHARIYDSCAQHRQNALVRPARPRRR